MIRERVRGLYRRLVPLFFARRQYKLLLKAGVGELDRRRLQLAALTDYFSPVVEPIPVGPPFGRSVLVVAPHQDDEVIGCGGALARHVRSGGRAAIAMLQDGADEHAKVGMSRDALTRLRNQESRRAAAMLGLEPLFLNYPDLRASAAVASDRLAELLHQRAVDCVFTPYVLDGHPHHQAANAILARALTRVPRSVRVLGYEVWGLCIPNVLVIIDDVMDLKLEMLACFAFANQAVDYVNSTRGLNLYRSRLLGAGRCRYAECFFELPREEYIALVERLETELGALGSKLEPGSPQHDAAQPAGARHPEVGRESGPLDSLD